MNFEPTDEPTEELKISNDLIDIINKQTDDVNMIAQIIKDGINQRYVIDKTYNGNGRIEYNDDDTIQIPTSAAFLILKNITNVLKYSLDIINKNREQADELPNINDILDQLQMALDKQIDDMITKINNGGSIFEISSDLNDIEKSLKNITDRFIRKEKWLRSVSSLTKEGYKIVKKE